MYLSAQTYLLSLFTDISVGHTSGICFYTYVQGYFYPTTVNEVFTAALTRQWYTFLYL